MKQSLYTYQFFLFAALPALVWCIPTSNSPSSSVPADNSIQADLLTEADGPLSNVASYLLAADFDNLMHSSKTLRKSSFFYSKKAFRIPYDASEDYVRQMLPSIQLFEKVTIGFNLGHLLILQECPKLRHLIVGHENPGGLNESTVASFIDTLSTFGNLTQLKIGSNFENFPVDIAPLETLTMLTELDIFLPPSVVGINTLSNMTKLTKLTLWAPGFSDISILYALTQLKELNIMNALYLEDLSPLIGLKRLTKLNLHGCRALTEISPLKHLNQLTELNLSFSSEFTDFSPLSGLKNLVDLYLSGTRVTDLSPLSCLTNLVVLDLRGTRVTDLSPLEHLTQLTKLDLLHCRALTDISPLSGLNNLVKLYLRGTRVTDLSPLEHLTQLTELDFVNCRALTDISPLSGLNNLVDLYLRGSHVTDLSPLEGMINLIIHQ
jgi:Leucine-rich repeat (LRR) protein